MARAATDGSSLVAGISSGATALSADSTGMPWTNAGADLPFDISVRPANVSAGERMTVTAAAGASLTGAYLDQAGMGAADFNAANTIWTGWTGLGMKVSKVFLAAPAAIPQRMTQMNAAGIKICVCLAPAFNPVSATDLANITTLMQAMQAAGMTADVALWQEPYYRGLTAAQYIAGVNYYGPTIRTYYPLVFSTALSSVQNNNENSFYPGDAAVDKIATDYYSINYVNGASLDLAASVADSAVPPKPFGLWEFNALVNGGNFLVQPDAGFEPNSAGDWTNAGNCSIAPGNAQAHSGSWSLALTSAAAGNMAAAHCTAGNITTLGLPCAAGDSIQTTTWFRAQASARSCQAAAAFYTSAGVFVSTLTGGSVTNSTTAWTQGTGTVTAPATAAFCRANPGVLATGAASEVHYIDDVTLTNLNSGYTQAQITAMFNDLRSYFAGRLSGGRKNADLLLYNGAGPNSTEIAAGSDFRIALFQSIAAALNSTSAPQAFTVTRSVNGVVRAHTAGEAITLFTPAVAPLT